VDKHGKSRLVALVVEIGLEFDDVHMLEIHHDLKLAVLQDRCQEVGNCMLVKDIVPDGPPVCEG
jgi:hypothetical protein